MSVEEFECAADRLEQRLIDLDRDRAIALACRGSGNPAVLAWLAEAAELAPGARVVDIGGGLGGPAAWFRDHYRWRVVSTDPVHRGNRTAKRALAVPAVTSCADRLPFPTGSADLCVLLGVLSVVDSVPDVLREARRVGGRLALLAYVSTDDEPLSLGGSVFPARDGLQGSLRDSGWTPIAGPAEPALPPPPSWAEQEPPDDLDDDGIEQAIAQRRIIRLAIVAE